MSPKNIFDEEESIITLARSLMTAEDTINSPLFPHFSELLASYIKLNTQFKRIIKLSDKQHGKLSALNKEMQHIFSHIPVGIVIIDAEGQIQPAYSQHMSLLFPHEKKLDRKPIESVLYWEDGREKDKDTFKSWLKLVFDANYDWELIKDLGPEVIRHEGNGEYLYYQNTYHRVIQNDNDIYLIIHITDISEKTRQKIALEEQEATHQFEVDILSCIVDHEYSAEVIDFINDIERLIQESRKVFTSLAGSTDKPESFNHLYRLIHSVKGLSGAYGIKEFVRLANQAEDILSLLRNNEIDFETGQIDGKAASEKLHAIIKKMSDFMRHAEEIIQKIFNQTQEVSAAIRKRRRGLKIETDRLDRVIQKMKILKTETEQNSEGLSDSVDHVLAEIMSLSLQPLDVVYKRLKQIVKDVSASLDKDVDLVLEGDRIYLDPDSHHLIITSLIHLLRNSLDHGIEPPDKRVEAGKTSRGTIHIRTKESDGMITIEFSDDGRGIAPDRVAEKTAGLGLVPKEKLAAMDDQEKINLVFLPGFSSKSEVTDLSGRGVGMDTVLDCMNTLKGKADLSSEIGKGATVTLSFPSPSSIQNGR